jgi:alcohol dehydrogenase
MDSGPLPAALADSSMQVLFGAGRFAELGRLIVSLGARRALLVSDPGLVAAGYVQRAARLIRDAGVETHVFDGARENPTTEHVDAGLETARRAHIDFIVGLGGGSAMDCAKGINILLTNGGRIQDYWGVDKTTAPMLPSVLVPTTTGTGSEAQSFALISDAESHQKMACGDRRPPGRGGLRPLAVVLDPELTRTQPAAVAAATGIDALSHAVETAGARVRNERSLELSREAWRRLDANYERIVSGSADDTALAEMLLGAHLAGAAIEASMLGAAHACANPLTARFGVTHGVAVGLLLPHVVRYNSPSGSNPYDALCDDPQAHCRDAEALAQRIESLLSVARLPCTLRALHVPRAALAELAAEAAAQWTAQFNPRAVGARELLSIYEAAFGER